MTRESRRNERIIGIWLLCCCAVLLALILLGGATRLTGSGLSMTDWRPVTGLLPPLTEQAWEAELERYRQSPEYQQVNRGMSVDQFKVIYYYEYAHRILARSLGLVFALPLVFFWLRGMIPARLRWPLLGLLLLGAAQGYMGWYMVQSGLVDIPRVSPYRLAAHLSLALIIYAIMFRLAVGLLWPARKSRTPGAGRAWTVGLLALVAVTLVSGAFVAGLKAGWAYNTFPLMAGRWVPEGVLGLEPLWRNFFENPATVQFGHRVLAISTLAVSFAAWLWALRRAPAIMPHGVFHAMFAVALVQVALGIATLLFYVPTPLAVIHQGGAVALLSVVLVADYRLAGSRRALAQEPPAHMEPAPG